MKPATFIAILLTFLMAILVLSAAVFFLWQGSQELQAQSESHVMTSTAQASELQQLEAIRDSESAALVTKQAELSTRDAEFLRISQEVVQLEQQLDRSTESLATAVVLAATPTPNAAVLAAPVIEFLSPLEGATFEVGNSTEVAFFVGHPAGIAAVELSVDDQVIDLETVVVVGQMLQRFDEEYRFLASGEVVFSVVAASTLGAISEPALVTVTVNAPPTPTPLPAPTVTPIVTDTTGDAGVMPATGLLVWGRNAEDLFSRLTGEWGLLADPRRL